MSNDQRYLNSCLKLVDMETKDTESVLRLERGKTRFGRQTFLYYKIHIGTFVNNAGGEPVDVHSIVAEINVDTPDSARVVDAENWEPIPF